MWTSSCWILASVLVSMASTQAQTTNDGVASFISEAYSVYNEVTSILASVAQNTATSTSNSSTSSSTSPSTSSTRSITSMSVSPSSRLTSSASLAGAAATSSTASSSATSGSHHNTLATVLGSVLGALALSLLLLALVLICCRRHRRKTRSQRAILPGDEDIDSRRGNSGHGLPQTGFLGTHATSGADHSMAAAAAPDMAEHPAFRNSHENPFVPVPPPPRRTAPNSKVGLTDGIVSRQEPFISGKGHRINGVGGTSSSLPPQDHNYKHHGGEALAAGVGGAALGAAAMRHHNKDPDSDPTSQKRYSGNRRSLVRKPVPDAIHTGDGSDTALLDRAANSPTLSPFNSAGHHRSHSQEALLAGGAAAGAGALGGAAVADHHKQHGHDTDSGFFSNHDARTPAARTATPLVSPIMTQSHHQRNAMPPEYDMIPNNDYANRNSRPISGIAPAAALGAHRGDRNVSPIVEHNNNRHTRNSTPPAVPSRSPRRTRFSDVPYDPASQALTSPFPAVLSADRDSNNSSKSSGDSAFRLGSSIPGGWRCDSTDSDHHLRNSGINQHGRRSNSPRTDARDFAIRDSGISGKGTRRVTIAGARRYSPVISPGVGPGVRRHSQSPGDITSERVRLSDLRAEEEYLERERQRGRRYGGMTSEWAGGGGYDGYERGSYGIGRAL